jgi:hypothetical protein
MKQTAVVAESRPSEWKDMNNVRLVANTIFRTKKMEYLTGKINELQTKSKNKNINDLCRGIN